MLKSGFMNTKNEKYGNFISEKYFIKKCVKKCGVSQNYTAHYFLVDIIDLLVNENLKVKSFSREVYPMLAQKYNKKDCTIERNIRNAIDICWQNKDEEDKPTVKNLFTCWRIMWKTAWHNIISWTSLHIMKYEQDLDCNDIVKFDIDEHISTRKHYKHHDVSKQNRCFNEY